MSLFTAFLPEQPDNPGGNQNADENTAAIQEDILDRPAAGWHHELVNFIRDGIDGANEEAV